METILTSSPNPSGPGSGSGNTNQQFLDEIDEDWIQNFQCKLQQNQEEHLRELQKEVEDEFAEHSRQLEEVSRNRACTCEEYWE